MECGNEITPHTHFSWLWRSAFSKTLTFLLIVSFVFSDIQSILNLSFLPSVEKAQASTGDFAIFRESSGTETIPSTGTPLDLTWDTTVASNSNISLLGNNSDIDLADGGKYLVLYSAWAEQGTSTAGANRRSISSYLSLNGTEISYGHGGGYIRDSESDLTAYASGGAILATSPGDDLQLHVKRTDTNSGAGTNIPPNTNGVSVVKLKDTWDFARLRRAATSSSISANTSFTDVTWDASDEVDTGSFAFTPTSGNITLKGSAGKHFLVTTNVNLRQTAASGNRQNYEASLYLGGSEIAGTRTSTYIRGTDGTYSGSLVYTGIVTKTSSADQTLNIKVRRESSASATTVIVGGQTSISMVALPDTAEYVSLTDQSGTQTLTASRVAMNWNKQNEVDNTAFSHSTTSNSSRININKTGNYLFFSTVYDNTTTSGNNRQPHRIDWRKNGSSYYQYGGHGGFNRANATFSAGSSGGLIMSGLSVSDYVEITHIDETTSAPVDATFGANRISIQGVILNENFFGTDVVVSATGANSSDFDIPSTAVYQGGKYIFSEQSSSRNITNITLTESGSVDAETGLNNIKILYDLDTTAPYDCASESYSGSESQFGSTDTNGFSGADGVSSFSSSVTISTTQSLCAYIVYDVTDSANDSDVVQISIANPSTDVTVSGAGSVGPLTPIQPSGSTSLHNSELTQLHYHWRNDDGNESLATSIDGTEDTPAIGFTNGTIRRLRILVSPEGSTSSPATQYRLEYAQKITSCSAVASWTDVGTGGGGDWDVVNSPNLTDGNNTTNVALAALGAVTDPPSKSFLGTNGGQKDTSSQTGSITLTNSQFLELEFAIEPTSGAPQGNTYCFRLSNAGSALRNYTVYPEATISADINISASSSQNSSVNASTANNYLGGTFVITRSGGTRTVTGITMTESGTVDGQAGLDNIKLLYDLDTTAPYDCTGESYSGTETQFGSTDSDGFSGSNGSSTFSGSETINNTRSMCVYVVYDTTAAAANAETINISIANPSTEVIVTSSSVGPSTPVSPTGSTTIAGPILTQVHYHWRNDDGSETGATSATAGNEDVGLLDLPKGTPKRLRIEVSNEGSVISAGTQYRLEYGTKISTCSAVGTWVDVSASAGAFDMSNSINLTDGNNTTDVVLAANGAVTNENTSFLLTNGGQKDTSSQTGSLALSNSEFVELEYSIVATADSAYGTTYCFRVSNAGTPIAAYDAYPELTTREKQDFYIQRGTAIISGTSLTLTAGTDYIAPATSTSAFIRITNTQITGAGNDTGGGNQNADDVTAYIQNPENIETSVTLSRPGTATGNTIVAWEIIEFVGLAGSDNEMIVRDQGTVSYSAAQFQATGTTASLTDPSDVVVFITGQQNTDTSTNNFNDGQSTASWNNSISAPVFERGDADSNVNLSYAVVEFTGSNWNIQRVEHIYGSAGVTETESIVALSSLSRSFIHTQKRIGAGLSGLDEFGHEVWLSSIGAVSFALDSGATTPTNQVSVVWIIENTQIGTGAMSVQRNSGTLPNTGSSCGGVEPCLQSISLGSAVKVSNASLFANNSGAGSGTAYPRPIIAAIIASTTAIELWRSDTGQPQSYRTEVISWPVAETSLKQNYYRLYVDNDMLTPTDPWPIGAADLGENAAMTSIDDPIAEGEKIRLRISAVVTNATLPDLTKSLKLQYGKQDTTCSAIVNWIDVGTPGSGEIWRGYNGSVMDGTELATSTPAPGKLLLSVSDTAGTYEEVNDSAVNPYSVAIGDDIEYDWVVQHNGALQKTNYCFRMINSDDTVLPGYNNYPTLRTTGYTPVSTNWRWYDDATSTTPTSPLSLENFAPVNVANQNEIKLRVGVHEVENASGVNVNFALQYSEYPDFSDGGKWVTSTTTCVANSIWCYADGAGVDKGIIDSSVLTDSDSCLSGSGSGCGQYNESTTTLSTFTQVANARSEFEFTLVNAGARANAVYYFRLYDQANDDFVFASSSYPSLLTESASIVVATAGVTPGDTVEGFLINATTTPTSVDFGEPLVDTEYVAAHRLSLDTNATEGYQVFVYSDQDLTNSYGQYIPPITSTNLSPTGWSTSCLTSATGCFGYHAGDDVLYGGSSRFAAQDSFAAFNTTPSEVFYNSSPGNHILDMIYKLQLTELQEAGIYESSISYIIVPVY